MIKTLNIVCLLLFMPLMHSPCKFMLYADHYMYLFTESKVKYEGWNFNSGNYLFTTDTK